MRGQEAEAEKRGWERLRTGTKPATRMGCWSQSRVGGCRYKDRVCVGLGGGEERIRGRGSGPGESQNIGRGVFREGSLKGRGVENVRWGGERDLHRIWEGKESR